MTLMTLIKMNELTVLFYFIRDFGVIRDRCDLEEEETCGRKRCGVGRPAHNVARRNQRGGASFRKIDATAGMVLRYRFLSLIYAWRAPILDFQRIAGCGDRRPHTTGTRCIGVVAMEHFLCDLRHIRDAASRWLDATATIPADAQRVSADLRESILMEKISLRCHQGANWHLGGTLGNWKKHYKLCVFPVKVPRCQGAKVPG
jgi:hypothetical protein